MSDLVTILSRYVFRAVLRQVVLVSTVLLLIVVVLQFTRMLARAAAEHFPTDLLWMIVAWGAAQNVAVIVPIGLSLGIVLSLGKLCEDHEIAAMEACGAGGPRIWTPIVLLVVFTAGLLAWLTLVYNPHAAAQADMQKGLALRLGMYLTPHPGEFRSFAGGQFVLYASKVDESGLMESVFAHHLGPDGESVAVARSARIERSYQGVPIAILLKDGTTYQFLDKRLRQRIVRFSEQRVGLNVSTEQQGPLRTDATPTRTLLGSSEPKQIAELHGRLALPIMALVLGCIAIPLGRLRPRQGRYARAGVLVLIYFVYTNLTTAGQNWIASSRTPPSLGLWWVHGAIAAVAIAAWVAPGWWRRHKSRSVATHAVTS